MDKKVFNIKKTFFILSSGVILVEGINQYRISEADKLIHKLKGIKFGSYYFGDEYFYLNNAYYKLIGEIRLDSSTSRKHIMDEFDYKVCNFVASLSNDSVNYTFCDSYIKIDINDLDKSLNCSCYYNNDGSYSIICNWDKKIDYDFIEDKSYNITYNFSKDGILTDSIVNDDSFTVKYFYNNGSINDYETNMYKSNTYKKK